MIKDIVLAGGSYTPMGALMGYYTDVSAAKLGSVAIKKALERAKVKPADVDEVYMGNCVSAGLGQNVARQAALGAGLPTSVGAVTMAKMCGSGMFTIMAAAQAIQAGDAQVVVAGGTENMTQAPYLLPKARVGYRLGHGQVIDAMVKDGLTDAYGNKHMGECAEMCAKKYNFTRQMQDDYGIESFKRVIAAQKAGHLRDIIAPVEVQTKKGTVVYEIDEEPTKFDEAKFRTLKPVFAQDGTITAGNASAISDGAAAIVVLSAERAKQLGVRAEARILGYSRASQDPEWFTTAPVAALKILGEKLGRKLSDFDLFEVNEAFAPVAMAAIHELKLPHDRVNVFGGAIAQGHPIGMSGTRVVVSLINALRIHGKKTGVATLCIGGGEATAMAVELLT